MILINSTIDSVTAFAPATCANVAVGFDILGFAFEKIGDQVTLTRRDDTQIVIESIDSAEKIPLDTDKNTASVVIEQLCYDLMLPIGFSISIKKGIPLSSGMGGSAASAIAALLACNAFLSNPLSLHELARYGLIGEALASGQPHADNIIPCLFGGLTLIQSIHPIAVQQLPVPDLFCVLVHPHLHVATKQARAVLEEKVSLQNHVKQSANLACFIAALYQNDMQLLQQSLTDILIEPQRAQFIPGFYNVKTAALHAGALGFSFSGSGPSVFAFAKNKNDANTICTAIQSQLKQEKIDSDAWISRISQTPAHIIQTKMNSK